MGKRQNVNIKIVLLALIPIASATKNPLNAKGGGRDYRRKRSAGTGESNNATMWTDTGNRSTKANANIINAKRHKAGSRRQKEGDRWDLMKSTTI